MLKKEYKNDRKVKEETETKVTATEKEHANEMVQDYMSEQRKYSNIQKDLPKKGDEREKHTLLLLNKFKAKLETIKNVKEKQLDDDGNEQQELSEEVNDEELNSDKWLSHTLRFDDSMGAVLAKDASSKKDDWHDIYDPRNPLNKRKRGEGDRHHNKDRSHSHRDRK